MGRGHPRPLRRTARCRSRSTARRASSTWPCRPAPSHGDVAAEYARRAGLGSVPELHTRTGAPIPGGTELTAGRHRRRGTCWSRPPGVTPAVVARSASARRYAGSRARCRRCGAASPPRPPCSPAGAHGPSRADGLGPARRDRRRRGPVGALRGCAPGRRGPGLRRCCGVRRRVGPGAGAAADGPRTSCGLAAALAAAVGRSLAPRGRGGAAGLDRRRAPCSSASPGSARSRARRRGSPGRCCSCWRCWPPGSCRACAIDVPDQFLIDLERLAVTAWSAREPPSGKRAARSCRSTPSARSPVHGTRLVTAACVAIARGRRGRRTPAAGHCHPADRPHRRPLPGRLHRRRAAARGPRATGTRRPAACCVRRGWAAGSRCSSCCSATCPTGTARWRRRWGRSRSAVVLVVVAVAVGRGWRSAWWSRRAEVAETLSVAFALASVVGRRSGGSARLWELASLWEMEFLRFSRTGASGNRPTVRLGHDSEPVSSRYTSRFSRRPDAATGEGAGDYVAGAPEMGQGEAHSPERQAWWPMPRQISTA